MTNSKTYTYRFYWDNDREGFNLDINCEKRIVERYLSEYKMLNPREINDFGWCAYLKKKGIEAKPSKNIPDYMLFF